MTETPTALPAFCSPGTSPHRRTGARQHGLQPLDRSCCAASGTCGFATFCYTLLTFLPLWARLRYDDTGLGARPQGQHAEWRLQHCQGRRYRKARQERPGMERSAAQPTLLLPPFPALPSARVRVRPHTQCACAHTRLGVVSDRTGTGAGTRTVIGVTFGRAWLDRLRPPVVARPLRVHTHAVYVAAPDHSATRSPRGTRHRRPTHLCCRVCAVAALTCMYAAAATPYTPTRFFFFFSRAGGIPARSSWRSSHGLGRYVVFFFLIARGRGLARPSRGCPAAAVPKREPRLLSARGQGGHLEPPLVVVVAQA